MTVLYAAGPNGDMQDTAAFVYNTIMMHGGGRRGSAQYRGDSFTDHLEIRLFTAKRVAIDRRWQTRHVCSSYWRYYRNDAEGASLVVAASGVADAYRVELDAGRSYLVPAGVRFDCCNRATGPIGHLYVHFDVLGLAEPMYRVLFDRPLQVPAHPLLEPQVARLSSLLDPDSDPSITRSAVLILRAAVKALLYESLTTYLETVSRAQWERLEEQIRGMDAVQPALDYLQRHLSEKLRCRDLAAHCCMSEVHFRRTFHAQVGVSPMDYLRERRIQRATQDLLFAPEDSIEAVAERYGFRNRHYFTRVFTQRMGVPPAAYRKANAH
jgi:AraC-like DNA-binding protein